MGAVLIGNDTTFSDPIDLKNGTTYVDRHSDSYERWGDYFAVQPMFDANGELIPSEAWMAGFYGDGPNQNRTFISQVFSNDTVVPLHPDGGRVFPNPVADNSIVTVEFNLEVEQNIEARLYYENGQLVQELAGRLLPSGPAELFLDMSTLSQGVYIIKIQGDAGFEKVARLVRL